MPGCREWANDAHPRAHLACCGLGTCAAYERHRSSGIKSRAGGVWTPLRQIGCRPGRDTLSPMPSVIVAFDGSELAGYLRIEEREARGGPVT
jgi:hypothetical protein